MVTVVNSVGSRLRVFSNVSETSARPDAALVLDPLKIRSSRLSDRSDFILCSPITHLMASTIFDLPQPFGPTIPVIGLSSRIRVLSAKDLKPFISKDFNLKASVFLYQGDANVSEMEYKFEHIYSLEQNFRNNLIEKFVSIFRNFTIFV